MPVILLRNFSNLIKNTIITVCYDNTTTHERPFFQPLVKPMIIMNIFLLMGILKMDH